MGCGCCDKCNKTHDAVYRAGGLVYYKFVKTGHFSRDFTTTTTQTSDLVCFYYNKRGHKKAKCLSLASGGLVVAPAPVTLGITDGRKGKAEAPVVRRRAFLLIVEETHAALDVVIRMYILLFFLLRVFSCLYVCITV